MTKDLQQKSSISNPALEPFSALIGEWATTGTHPLVPDTTLHGRASFEWIEGGAYLMWRSEIDHPSFPRGMAIFGSDDAMHEYFMLYCDSRGVSRKHEMSFENNVWKWWRNAPGFSQRYIWTLKDDGCTMISKGELSKDGSTWEKDLDLIYTRVK